jgi:predicted RNA-binding Zn ribbon-like protein
MELLERPIAKVNLIGGRVCLDFVNTVGGWTWTRAGKGIGDVQIRAEGLNEYGDLLAWSLHAHVLHAADVRALAREAARHETAAAAVLDRARGLREAIFRLCASMIASLPPRASDLERLNEELHLAHTQRYIRYAQSAFHWEWNETKEALDCMLWPIADSAADLLVTGDLTRLRECPGENCGWLFEDTSKSSRRQWCDMQTCGNLAKVRRFRERMR